MFGTKKSKCDAKFKYHRQHLNSKNCSTTKNLPFCTKKTSNPTDSTPNQSPSELMHQRDDNDIAQCLLEGEKYVTCSLVIAMIQQILESSKATLANFNTLQAPRGVKVLETVVFEFNNRFGDGNLDLNCFCY